MVTWQHQYPSVALRKTYGSTPSSVSLQVMTEYAERFHGEAYKLLYELKNQMTFRRLGQLQMTRFFTDGTVITAKSHFGNDILNIDVSRSVVMEGVTEECTITLVNLPDSVQPMRYPREIRSDEIEGVDYIKTYYGLDTTRCSGCKDQPDISISFTFQTDEQVDYYDSEPNNHCVISQDGGCSGEIIEQGNDYIIWKVYTESSNHTRSGLGYAQLWARIFDGRDLSRVICEFKQVVEVDCCKKSDIEPPEIYWENWQWAECASEILFYGGTELCEVPAEISRDKLFWYAAGESGRAARFYALPEIGGCPPYEWRLQGPGSLEVSDSLGRMAVYLPPSTNESCEDIIITVSDRCGAMDEFVASCCRFAGIMSIEYTSLQMSVGTSQDLGANGGCPPYNWSMGGGGGTLEVLDALGLWARYTAPATNTDCVNNPTIFVTDCCGKSTDIKLAINAYMFPGTAYRECLGRTCPPLDTCTVVPCGFTGVFCATLYNCQGAIFSGPACFDGTGVNHGYSCDTVAGLACEGTPPCLPDDYYIWWNPCGGVGWGGCLDPNQECNTCHDYRSASMINQGCCPINPQTGLPF